MKSLAQWPPWYLWHHSLANSCPHTPACLKICSSHENTQQPAGTERADWVGAPQKLSFTEHCCYLTWFQRFLEEFRSRELLFDLPQRLLCGKAQSPGNLSRIVSYSVTILASWVYDTSWEKREPSQKFKRNNWGVRCLYWVFEMVLGSGRPCTCAGVCTSQERPERAPLSHLWLTWVFLQAGSEG